MLHEGKSIAEACRSLGVSDSTYYKWRKEYGGIQIIQAKRLKERERENNRLKKAVADLTVDKLILHGAGSESVTLIKEKLVTASEIQELFQIKNALLPPRS